MQVIGFVAVLIYRAPLRMSSLKVTGSKFRVMSCETGNIVDTRVVWRNLDALLLFPGKEYFLAPPLCRLDHFKHLITPEIVAAYDWAHS